MGKELRDDITIVVHSFIPKHLNLYGNDAMIFALIYGFHKDGISSYDGGIDFIQKWTDLSKPTVIKKVDKLIEMNLVIKTKRYRMGNMRMSLIPNIEEIGRLKNLTLEGKKTLPSEGKKTLPPIEVNKEVNKELNIYGEFENVYLTDEQVEKLKTRFNDFELQIEAISAWKAKGNKTKNDYATLVSWDNREKKKRIDEEQAKKAKVIQQLPDIPDYYAMEDYFNGNHS